MSLISYSQCTGYQIYESFSSSLPTQGGTWAQTSITYSTSTTALRNGSNCLVFNAVGDIIRTPLIASPGVFSFWYKRSGTSTGSPQFTIETSTDNTSWTSRGTVTPGAAYTQYSVDLGALVLSNVYVRVRDTRTSGTAERYIDDMSWTSLNSTLNTLFPAISNCSQTIANGTTYTFTDRGGSSDTYNNSLSQSFTFSPGTAGMKVEINFSSLVGEVGAGGTLYDYIRVYNGPTTASTLIGTYTSVPGSVITSTASGGELTVTFTSDVSTVYDGWVSTIYLVSSCTKPTSLSLSSTSSTSANMSWTAPSSAPSSGYEWEIRTSGVGGSGATGLTTSGSTAAGVVSTSTSSLTQNTTYTLYVRSNCGGSDYSGWASSSTMTTPYSQPSNDNCSGATTLACATSNLAGTTLGSVSETAPNASTSGTMGVWYKFTGDGGSTTITINQTLDTRLLVLTSSTGSCGGTYTTIANIDEITSTNETTTFTTTNGTNYYIYIGYYTSGANTGNFTISRTCVYPPSNDNPAGAIQLTVNNSLGYVTYTNVNSTGTTGVTAPGCASYVSQDVWFKVTVPSNTTTMDFDTQTGGITDGGMAIYRGTVGSLTLIECDDDDGLDGAMPWINRTDFVSNETIYIRFWEYGGDLTGTFKMLVSAPQPLPVVLKYFDGVTYPLFNVLKWSTESESNSDYFSIQRSSDGYDWRNITSVKAAGNSNEELKYSFIDSYMNNGYVYYKLIQYDFDGKSKEYGPISLYYSPIGKKVVKYINSMGQEVDPSTKGIIFEVYDDGTMKKIIK